MSQPSSLQSRPRNAHANQRPAFSLIELLVVMFIIVLVISIVVPALAKVRKTTKIAATEAFMSNVLNSSLTFQNDERRLPGRYSVRDMGSNDNGTNRGMSMAENVMLDLGNGIAQVGGADPGTGAIAIHPFAGSSSSRISQEACWIDIGLIGQSTRSGKGYFTPDPKYFVQQVNAGSTNKQAGSSGDSDNGKPTFPDLVDAFGQPLVIWVEDETVVGRIKFDSSNSGPNNFARITSTGNDPPARHYWNANACFLEANSLGKLNTDAKAESLLGSGGASAEERARTLMGLLGSLAGPSDLGSPTAATPANQIIPTASRGKITIMSAGADGIYLNKGDGRGRAQFLNNAMDYGYNFVDPGSPNKLRLDDAGKPTTLDVAKAFDDQIVSGGS